MGKTLWRGFNKYRRDLHQALRLEFPTFNGKDPDSWCLEQSSFLNFILVSSFMKYSQFVLLE
jgi:hypothetical protein